MAKMPCRAQREWRAFERAMARSKHSGRMGHPNMFTGRLLKGNAGPKIVVELGEAATTRVMPK